MMLIFYRFLTHLGPKMVPKMEQNRFKNQSKNQSNFESIFYRFWLHFGLQLGGPRGSNEPGFRGQVGSRSHLGAQVPPGTHPSSISNRSGSTWGRFWVDFGWFLVDFWMHLPWLGPGLPTASKCLTPSSHRQTWAHNMQD